MDFLVGDIVFERFMGVVWFFVWVWCFLCYCYIVRWLLNIIDMNLGYDNILNLICMI